MICSTDSELAGYVKELDPDHIKCTMVSSRVCFYEFTGHVEML